MDIINLQFSELTQLYMVVSFYQASLGETIDQFL